MSVNSTSSSTDSLHPNASSNNSDLAVSIACFISRPASFIFTSYIITSILLLLPLCIFILYHGLHQWRKKPSTSSAAAAMSHSDVFTYHMVLMELVGVFGGIFCCSGVYSKHLITLNVGLFLLSFKWYGETFFHVLTCVERYLAVVHPITYLSLKRERGIRIRNIIIGCVWLLCFATIGAQMVEILIITIELCLMILSLIIISFCSFSVLCVLIHPGPGEQGGGRVKVDQSKQRAFYTIMVILGLLVVRFCWGLVQNVFSVSGTFNCVMISCGIWINLPSSLVLPLLFLHRAGKLVCWKNNIQTASGRD